MNTSDFNRTKIYERLDYKEEPATYSGKIPWKIQQQIAATNGIHFVSEIGRLSQYPIPDLPISEVRKESDCIMLDIGCGWGRWLIAGARKNYIPIGIDIRHEFCTTTLEALKENNISGYAIVADLNNLPFKDNVFDFVWSFSVIQHTHKDRMLACLKHIKRILKPKGFTKLEFPNKNGLRNRFGPVKKFAAFAKDYNSWCVRYYTVKEYKDIFKEIFHSFSFANHSFLGIGVLPSDLKYIKNLKSKLGVIFSLTLSALTNLIPGMKYLSDSIYIKAIKEGFATNTNDIESFLHLHQYNKGNNLNIVPLLRCPISKMNLVLSNDRQFLISENGNIRYPVINNVPILIESEAILS